MNMPVCIFHLQKHAKVNDDDESYYIYVNKCVDRLYGRNYADCIDFQFYCKKEPGTYKTEAYIYLDFQNQANENCSYIDFDRAKVICMHQR